MRFAYDWLKRHLDTEKSVYEIADELTSLGIEVDAVSDNYDYLKNFSVATVTELRPHPDSDHLKICTVDTGEGIVTIVTGAANVKKGKKYPLAKIGTFIPNGETGRIKKIIGKMVFIQFDKLVCYDYENMKSVKLAYSISTHKSQGSQSKIIILLTPKSHTYMLNSNLLYVAITRASQKVIHFG